MRALPEIKSRALRFARIQGICHVSCIQVTHFDSVSKKCRQEHVVFEGEVFGQHWVIQKIKFSYMLLCLLFFFCFNYFALEWELFSLLLHWLTQNHLAGTFLLFSCNFRYIVRVWFALHVRGFLCYDCNFVRTDSPTNESYFCFSCPEVIICQCLYLVSSLCANWCVVLLAHFVGRRWRKERQGDSSYRWDEDIRWRTGDRVKVNALAVNGLFCVVYGY